MKCRTRRSLVPGTWVIVIVGSETWTCEIETSSCHWTLEQVSELVTEVFVVTCLWGDSDHGMMEFCLCIQEIDLYILENDLCNLGICLCFVCLSCHGLEICRETCVS